MAALVADIVIRMELARFDIQLYTQRNYGVTVEKGSRGVHIIFELDNTEMNPAVYEMAVAWAE